MLPRSRYFREEDILQIGRGGHESVVGRQIAIDVNLRPAGDQFVGDDLQEGFSKRQIDLAGDVWLRLAASLHNGDIGALANISAAAMMMAEAAQLVTFWNNVRAGRTGWRRFQPT